ncbi:MAG: DMT family transporter [Methylophilaceae bacterium]
MATESPSTHSQALIGTFFVLVAAIAFSSKAVMVKLAYGYHVDVETLLALRLAFAAPFYLAIALWIQVTGKNAHLTKQDAFNIIVLGTVGGYLPMWLDFSGLAYVSAGVERVILFLYPTMVILISAVLFGSRIGQREVFALLASYFGVALAAGAEVFTAQAAAPNALLGAVLIFLAAASYAAYLVASGKLIPRIGSTAFTAYIMLVVSLTSAVHLSLKPSHRAIFHQAPQVYAIGLLMALLATVLPSFLLNAGISRIGSNRAALMGTIGPVSTILLAWIFLGESVTAIQLIGTVFVVAGVLAISVH